MAAVWSAIAAVLAAFGLLHQASVSVSNFATPHGKYCIDLLDPVGAVSANAFVAFANTTAPGECAEGFVRRNNGAGCGWAATVQWRFTVAYLMVTALFIILLVLQRKGKPSLAPIRDGDAETGEQLQRTVQFPKDAEINAHIEDGPDEDERAKKRNETL